MMLSEVDSWIREDSDDPEAEPDLSREGDPEGTTAPSERALNTQVGLDEFLCEDEQPQQGQIWATSAQQAGTNLRQSPEAVPAESSSDSWPLLMHLAQKDSKRGEMQQACAEFPCPPAAGRGFSAPVGSATSTKRQHRSAADARDREVGWSCWLLWLRVPLKLCLEARLSSTELRRMCREAYYSRVMAYLYLGVLILNVWILFKCVVLSPIDAALVLAEAFVTLMLILEVSLRAVVMGPAFFSSCAHLFDCLVSVLCVALLIGSGDLQTLSRRPRAPPEAADDVLRQSLTALRVATQLMRVVPLALHQRRARVSFYDGPLYRDLLSIT
ncbi:hypothetical protein ACSSS7_005835 [Eimeria intestinalis]